MHLLQTYPNIFGRAFYIVPLDIVKMRVPPDFVDLNKIAVGMICWLHQYGMRHPGAATAMVPKSLKFLTRPLIFRAGWGKPFKKN